ncbi:hypothetical protein BS329_15310 [Amycolatopsis coloradensis]|uniref:Uncharacterized protein n=2 Tax=Amycolatopsis coloradensis TaxID=76021 RepID=A0A1R0KU36_9PSEU|nr:hypothetical protein BS329_15310 [Amycolatopsis coloradensis]
MILRLGARELADMAVLFVGPEMGMQRRYDPGWGALIEIAGVVRALEAVAAGEVPVDQVRQELVDLAERAEGAWLADQLPEVAEVATSSSIRCVGDCPACEAARPEFDAHNDEYQRRVDRARHLDRYPFAVSKSSIHTSSCHMAKQGLGISPARADDGGGLLYRHKLRSFVHGFRGDMTLPCLLVTDDELSRWRAERTGPEGGRRYRLCKICDPHVPLV